MSRACCEMFGEPAPEANAAAFGAADWLALETTKTGAVYRLKGNPPQAHE